MPILLLVFGFEMEEAVVLSNAAVMGNGLAQMAVNFGRRHPYDAKQTLIDWDAVLLLLPAQLGGGNVGVVVGAIFPTTVLLVMSIALLLVASGKTLTKARAQFLCFHSSVVLSGMESRRSMLARKRVLVTTLRNPKN